MVGIGEPGQAVEKSAFAYIPDDSNPPFSAKKSTREHQKTRFFDFDDLVWQYSMADRHPYKLARLVHYDYDLSKRWYVVFYAWHVRTERLTRKRLFEPINRQKTVTSRIREADYIIRQVNRELSQGKVLGKDQPVVNNTRRNILKLSLLEAVQYVGDQKKLTNHRKSYLHDFKRLKNNLVRWMEHDQINDFPLRSFTADNTYSFFDFLSKERKVGNKTFNNYRADLATCFNFLMKRNPNLFDSNPAMILDKLPVVNRKHAALSDAQMDQIKKEALKYGYKSLVLFIQFIYYTFGRPREVLKLRIENIDLANNRILFPGRISKNKTDGYVGLSPALKKILEAMDLSKHEPTDFIFGPGSKPGPRSMSYEYFYSRNKRIFTKIGLDKSTLQYSVYSYKHSGVISLYKATKDIKLVQSQCRHQSLEQTNNYLRDLELLSDYDGLKDWESDV